MLMRTLPFLLALALGSCGAIDVDGDGFAYDVDCNDYNDEVYPGAEEICDRIDNDCDGIVDPFDSTGAFTLFIDQDGDGFGDDAITQSSCRPEPGYTRYGGDCDDANPRINPGALERDCDDPVDYNCDGSVGFTDADEDGFAACQDCNDDNDQAYPGRRELCDGVDNDCNRVIDDEAIDATVYWADVDADGFGGDWTITSCTADPGFVTRPGDCADDDPDRHPGVPELCDGLDQDCDGKVDNNPINRSAWFLDEDLDGFGFVDFVIFSCEQPAGYVADGTDCNDIDDTVYPGAPETCDLQDSDCDGDISDPDATDALLWFRDIDADGYGDDRFNVSSCVPVDGYTLQGLDCDDTSADQHPNATETCGDGVDSNCDGSDCT